jgi:survival-of-motor-neuron-related-splicing factor 30
MQLFIHSRSVTLYLFQSGYLSGRKRESIFKSPDDPFGKVGVTGSGKGLTDFQKREKHLHLKGGTAENDDEAS